MGSSPKDISRFAAALMASRRSQAMSEAEMDGSAIWVIHAGRNDEAEGLFLNRNVGALGWGELTDLAQLEPTRDAIKAALVEANPAYKPGALPVAAGQIYRF